MNKVLRSEVFQVIAIEDKGWTLEYNRGPTTTFATSSEGRQSKVLGILMQTTRYKPIQVKWNYVVVIGLFALCGLIVIVICVCNNKRRSSLRGVQVGVEPYYCVIIYHNNQYQ